MGTNTNLRPYNRNFSQFHPKMFFPLPSFEILKKLFHFSAGQMRKFSAMASITHVNTFAFQSAKPKIPYYMTD